MKTFIDTNVILEFFSYRAQFKYVQAIFNAAKQGAIELCTSMSCLSTAIYIMGLNLKDEGIHEPEKRNEIRKVLNSMLQYVDIESFDRPTALRGLNDLSFKDLEDSLQYYCALENQCDCLVTINLKHFKQAKGNMKVLDPKEFVSQYIEMV
jgi:predicted nucleic acid-binding protein